ncbi:AAA family ATPase [Methanobrevibacter sp.]|uniref:AAA family ATPase n=1 Tax=Methanobrevibacter sp. TaxID=66852 RepID=UPI0038668F33
MDIRLKNIGIIKDSSIRLDGLTVITGANNSGKTTVGKVVYSLLDAVSNLSSKAENDRYTYVVETLGDIRDKLTTVFKIRRFHYNGEGVFLKDSAIDYLLSDADRLNKYGDAEEFSHRLRNELAEFDVNSIDENSILFGNYKKFSIRSNTDIDLFRDSIRNGINEVISIIDKMFVDIKQDPELIDYAREIINQTLNVEFSKQIQPVKVDVESSTIEMSDNNKVMFAFDIVQNEIVNDGNPVFEYSSYKKIYFIDNPFILDSVLYRRRYPHDFDNIKTILNSGRIIPHEMKLNLVLKRIKQTTIFKETIIDNGLSLIKEKIDEVISGDFEFSSDGEFYVKDGKKLHITNLATGSKMFSILKILLDKGEIDETTFLILDEPEAHLHPSWQNKFAEVIVLLVKYLNTQVLLTSHSPNFVLAIDAYMRKYDIIDKTNFYQTNCLDDGLVEYVNVNDDLGQIYSDFMRYLSEVKQLRDYYYNLGENHDS